MRCLTSCSACMMWYIVIYCALLVTSASSGFVSVDEEQKSSIQLELNEWDIEEDACDLQQNADWQFLLRDPEGYVDNKIDVTCRVAEMRRRAATESAPHLDIPFRNTELKRKTQILAYPGAALLPAEDFKKSTEFTVQAESKQRNQMGFLSYGPEQLDNVMLEEVPSLLARIRNATQLENIWRAWQRAQGPSDLEAWPGFLSFVGQAAELNGVETEEQYWELLSDWPKGYSKANKLWADMELIYKKFHGFVKRRLQARYKNVPDMIPVHLLGSPLGYDWSYIADLILPQADIYKTLRTALKKQNLGGEAAYKRAQALARAIGLPPLGDSLSETSRFNASCPAQLFVGCSDEGVRVVTCNEVSWQNFLDAHEAVFRASHHVLAAENSYIFRHGERYSGLAAGMSGLGSLLATADLINSGLIERDGSDPVGQSLNLRLLVALRVLPRLPALLATDVCRLRDAPFPPATPQLCWKIRTQMQGVSPPSDTEEEILWDVFGDSRVTSNAPYLSEFAGMLLQFQLLDHVSGGENTNSAFDGEFIKKIHIDQDFKTLLAKGLSEPWPKLLEKIGITQVSADNMLKFFEPLIPIFDDMSTVAEIPEYDTSGELPPPAPVDAILPAESSNTADDIFVTENIDNSTNANTTDNSLNLDITEASQSRPTTFIALAGVILGVAIVVASVFIVNRKRKQSQIIRNNGSKYEAVLRHSCGRPASFSPVVAKRLSENDNPPLPIFATFKENDIENNIPVKEV